MRQLLVFPAALLLLAACGSGSAGQVGDSGGSPGDSAGSASAAGTAGPLSSSSEVRATPTSTGCSSVPESVHAHHGEQPAAVCLTPGATLHIVTDPSPRQPWSTLTSTDESVVRCTSRATPDGAIEATCTAVKPGTVTVSTVTASFAGDPHGPAQYMWRLEITVVPR
jgi:hypothetical protein